MARGSVTAATGGGMVDILAPGCGITFGPLHASDAGSSFATPIVAASAWLRFLLDGTSPSAMRVVLNDAVLLTAPPSPRATLSGGVFDPARLIAPASMHYLDSTRQHLVSIADASLDGGACGVYAPFKDARGYQDFIVYQQSARFFLLRRHHVTQFPGVRVEDPCELSSLKFTAQTAAGPLSLNSPLEFSQRIGHLTF
jgi:hypothetical protein